MWLIAGLGNPGKTYEHTRHNLGAELLSYWIAQQGVSWNKQKHVWIADFSFRSEKIRCLFPQTYMNCSGVCLGENMRYYKVQPEQIIVAHDELDFPLGTLRLKTGGGAAGHNGVRSVIQHCGPQIGRLRLGIGATAPKQLDSGAEYVLGKFTNLEMAAIPAVMLKAAKAIELILEHGWAHAMQLVHRQEKG